MTHEITIAEANTLIARFLANKADILAGRFSGTNVFSNSQTFVASSVSAMLAQTGTAGLRAYFGMHDDSSSTSAEKINKIVLVLCSSDEEDNDLDLAPEVEHSTAIILQDAMICPPICSAPSQINNL